MGLTRRIKRRILSFLKRRGYEVRKSVRSKSAKRCYLCQEVGTVLYAGLRDLLYSAPGIWSLRRCPSCGLVWMDPRPEAQEIPKLYMDYSTHGVYYDGPGAGRRYWQRAILSEACGYTRLPITPVQRRLGKALSAVTLLRDIAAGSVMWLESGQGERLLDVGCGNGKFMIQMRELGWEVVGIEPDPVPVDIARAAGLDVLCATFEGSAFPSASVDVVTMNHVIEHVPDPVGTLRDCWRVLKPGGRVIVVTPNVSSLGRRWFGVAWVAWEPPRHLVLFSPRLLRTSAEKAGLRVTQLWTTARIASFIWRASHFIQRNGSIRDYGDRGWAWRTPLQAALFRGVEHLLTKVGPWGEEIVMVAEKPAASSLSKGGSN